ncbi:MAG: Uma2 family endonuclease [Symploca sp. SIO1A3]|nr:Uma2 family endonuclease [Symploca sp. SIO1A3]
MVQALDQTTIAKWSLDDYHQMIKAGILCDRQVELLDGNIVEMVPTEPLHDFLGDEVADYLRDLLGTRARVRECKGVTLPTSEPQPDIAIVERISYREHHPRPENIYLLIEIAKSRPLRDTETKRKLYAQAGIQEYWVINLKRGELRVFRNPTGADYGVDVVWNQQTIRALAFPDVVIALDKLGVRC